MKQGAKTILFVLSLAGLGAAGYFLTRKSKKELRQLIVMRVTDNASDRARWTVIVNKMTRQELQDTYRVLQFKESTPKSEFDKLGLTFKARIIAIGNKYNIFT